MPRKRKSDNNSPETTTAVAEPPAAEPKAAEPPAVEPPAAETIPEAQSFADKVGQKARVAIPDPFGIAHDKVAGVRLFEDKQYRQMAIKFDDKPSQAVIEMVKEAGYRWDPAERIWAHKVSSESVMRTRIEAERLYQEVRHMIRQEKSIEATNEVPF